jgi:hypothetical protein
MYDTQFYPRIGALYDWLLDSQPIGQHRQQVALIPGTFAGQESFLQDYFSYAEARNQGCNLDLGRPGVTGSFDRCPVWIVYGWLAGYNKVGSREYWGELEPNSTQIRNVWRNELSLPLAPGLAHQLTPAQIIVPLVNQLLSND